MPDRWTEPHKEIWSKPADKKDDIFAGGEFCLFVFESGLFSLEYMDFEGGKVSLTLDELRQIIDFASQALERNDDGR